MTKSSAQECDASDRSAEAAKHGYAAEKPTLHVQNIRATRIFDRSAAHDCVQLELQHHVYPFNPEIRVDQGTEFVSRDLDLWAYQRGVTLDFSRPGKPTDNAFIEAFNSRFRGE